MTNWISGPAAVVSRLEKLERQNRQMRNAVTTMILGVAATVLMGQTSQMAKTIEAEAIILRDQSGKMRVAMQAESASLSLFDANEQPRVMLRGQPDGSLVLISPYSRSSILLKDGSIILYDQSGRKRVFLECEGSIGLYDGDERKRIMLDVQGNVPRLTPIGPTGEIRREQGVTENEPGIGLFDTKGAARVAVSVMAGGPELGLFDSIGKVVFLAPTKP